MVEHKPEEAFSDVLRDVQLGRFALLSVRISQEIPRLTSLYIFSFLSLPLKNDCTFRWQHSSSFEQLTALESWKIFSRKQQTTEQPSCKSHPSCPPINFCSLYWVSGHHNFHR